MRASFGIAIGISAIDALLCAFTAITILALVVVSPTVVPGGSLAADIVTIEIRKVAIGKPTSTKLLLEVQATGEIVPIASAAHSETFYEESTASLFSSPEGKIEWSDSSCGGMQCTSHLFVTAPKPSWTARIRFAGEHSAEVSNPKVKLTIRKLSNHSSKCEGELSVTEAVVFKIDFNVDGGITC